jgi:glucokinase
MQAILANDADSAIAAELWVGAAKKAGVKNMVMLTLGTGVGAGVVVDGKMVTGATGMCGATCPVFVSREKMCTVTASLAGGWCEWRCTLRIYSDVT